MGKQNRHLGVARACSSRFFIALFAISQVGFVLWMWNSIHASTVLPMLIDGGKEDDLKLWAKLHGRQNTGHKGQLGVGGNVAGASMADNISPLVIEKARRSRALNNLRRPVRTGIKKTTTTTKKQFCMNVSASHVGDTCWTDIWQKAGCVGIPKYTSWVANQTHAELTAHAHSMFNAKDDNSVRECRGEEEYSRQWCMTVRERNATEETNVGPVCWALLWHKFGCTEPTPEYTQFLAQETFTNVESIAKSWATMLDKRHVQGCYGEGEPFRREMELGRRACDVIISSPAGKEKSDIGKECWVYLWHKAGCTQLAPAYSEWHAAQSFAALEDDSYSWARSGDADHVKTCRGQAGLDAVDDDRRTAARFA